MMHGRSRFGEASRKEAGFWRSHMSIEASFRRHLQLFSMKRLRPIPTFPMSSYFVPKNMAIKAEIMQKLGNAKESDELYRKSAALIDVMLAHAPTQNVERIVLAEMGSVYSGYFASLCAQRKYDSAFRTLEEVRGRVEAEALQHHGTIVPHAPTPEEQRLTKLNLALIDTDDPKKRAQITDAIYHTDARRLTRHLLKGKLPPAPLPLRSFSAISVIQILLSNTSSQNLSHRRWRSRKPPCIRIRCLARPRSKPMPAGIAMSSAHRALIPPLGKNSTMNYWDPSQSCARSPI